MISFYMESKNNDINKLISRTETDSQTQKTNVQLPKGKGGKKREIRNLRGTYTYYYI